MAGKPVRFHPEAEDEYLSSLAWYKERSLDAAFDFEAEFHQAISVIAEVPGRWPAYLFKCRRYVLHQFRLASCTTTRVRKFWFLLWPTDIGDPATGENGCGSRSQKLALQIVTTIKSPSKVELAAHKGVQA